ncbi:MAG: hypothetical protein ACO1OB_23215 [Archangium sp.]
MKWFTLIFVLSTSALADIAPPEPEPTPPPAQPVPAPQPTPTPPVADMQHPEGIEKVPMGVIQGGWGYVYAAYGVGLSGVLLYALSLFIRRPQANS